MIVAVIENQEMQKEYKYVYVEDKNIFLGNSFCNKCERLIPSRVVLREGYSYLIKKCPFDGHRSESLLGKGKFYKKIVNLPKNWPHWSLKMGKTISEQDFVNSSNVAAVIFDVTTRCNSNCKFCVHKYSQRLYHLDDQDLNIGFIKDKLSLFKSKEIALCGGEPTVREDIFTIIQVIRKSGNIPVLQTNGLKLADRKYAKKLKYNGLKRVYLSFDGFDRKIYADWRGGAHEYDLKLAALQNLKQEEIPTTLRMVVIKGINEKQISLLVNYAQQNRFISELVFMPLCLFGEESYANLDKNNLISKEEIKELIADSLGLTVEYFDLWNEVKFNLVNLLRNKFFWLNLPVFGEERLYLKRKGNGSFISLLDIDELRILNQRLIKGRILDLFHLEYLRLFLSLVKNGLTPSRLKNNLFILTRNELFRILIISDLAMVKDKTFDNNSPMITLSLPKHPRVEI